MFIWQPLCLETKFFELSVVFPNNIKKKVFECGLRFLVPHH